MSHVTMDARNKFAPVGGGVAIGRGAMVGAAGARPGRVAGGRAPGGLRLAGRPAEAVAGVDNSRSAGMMRERGGLGEPLFATSEDSGGEQPTASDGDRLKAVLAGVVVALANIPSSITFANIALLSPLTGLWSSVVLGLTSAVYGGRPGLIAGAAGVVVLPLSNVVSSHGASYVFPVVVVSALMQAAFAVLKLGKLVDLVSPLAMAGFLNALGSLLFMSQVKLFTSLTAAPFYSSVFLAAVTAATTRYLPRLTTAVPSSLVGVILSTLIAAAASLPVATLASSFGQATFSGGLGVLPTWSTLPALPASLPALANAASIVLPTAVSIALISVLETLLASRVIEEADPTGPTTDNDRTVLGTALGNGLSAMLGGFGGCGLIPQTVLSISSGGKGKLTTMACALSTAFFVVLCAPVIGRIPPASLAGLMMTVGLTTIQWGKSLECVKNVLDASSEKKGVTTSVRELLKLMVVTLTCFKVDMAVGLVVGVALDFLSRRFDPSPEASLSA